MDLWKNYKATVAEIFPDIEFVKRHAEWTNKKGNQVIMTFSLPIKRRKKK